VDRLATKPAGSITQLAQVPSGDWADAHAELPAQSPDSCSYACKYGEMLYLPQNVMSDETKSVRNHQRAKDKLAKYNRMVCKIAEKIAVVRL
jgi:hypothetical protein